MIDPIGTVPVFIAVADAFAHKIKRRIAFFSTLLEKIRTLHLHSKSKVTKAHRSLI
jgi:small neutral amino acid transporter SnatA (MarC family)